MPSLNNICVLCFQEANGVHHVIPLSAGGDDEDSNKVPLCVECHDRVQPRWKKYVKELLDRKELIERVWGN